MYDVVVVGGGPIGCKTAALLAKDHDVLVLEEHRESGLPVQCAGLITEETASLSGVKPTVLNRFHGANVIFPGGSVATIRSDEVKAIMIDRADFDRKLAESAIDNGAEIRYSVKYDHHTVRDGTVTVYADGEEIETRLLIGADGHSSKVSSSIPDNGPKEYLRGLQYDMKSRYETEDMITLRIGTDIAPGLFSWEAPYDDKVRAGLCVSWDAGLPSDYMKVLMKRAGLEGKEIIARSSGKIPIGRKRRTYANNLMLVGDAASQVKPVSAGGLYPALMSVGPLCQTANESFESGNLSAKMLSRYEKRWNESVGKELDRAYSMRKIYTRCTNDDMDRMFRSVGNDKASSILDAVDIDRPSSCAYLAMRNPATVIRLASIIVRSMVRR